MLSIRDRNRILPTLLTAVLLLSAGFPAASVAARQTGELEARIDSIFAEWDRPDSPGCALGVIRDGELIYTRGYGMANLEYGIPITSRSVFRIGCRAAGTNYHPQYWLTGASPS